MDSHKQPIEALKAEGDALKVQGSPEEQRIVDRWVEDTRKRYEDLKFTLDEREVSGCGLFKCRLLKCIVCTVSLNMHVHMQVVNYLFTFEACACSCRLVHAYGR